MSQFIFKMPDLGEGTVEAEIVAWHTKPGDSVKEDQVIVEVMTDKAAVEVPAPVGGRVVSITGAAGDKVAVGAPLIVFEIGAANGLPPATDVALKAAVPVVASVTPRVAQTSEMTVASTVPGGRVKASPANRRRAREAGIDLATVSGSGPGGRILRSDLMSGGKSAAGLEAVPSARAVAVAAETTEIKVIGLRRLIAERMSEAKRTIPHFAYVEEVDVTELESLRRHLNSQLPKGEPGLTYLPFVALALARTLAAYPQCNALYDGARGVLVRHRGIHMGVATQTPDGLKVPVVRDVQNLSLWDLAARIREAAERARTNKSTREELSGSTITLTSLGKWGGIASTPVINLPEVAIVGLNKVVERPVVRQGSVVVRQIMNLSSSFDHRFVDGYDGAAMIQALKDLLEYPATIFIPKAQKP